MSLHWPPRLTGFVVGYVQGLNFVLLLVIARAALADVSSADRYRLPLYLAAIGCVTANFITAIGNTMGDPVTALFELGALCIILSRWDSLLTWSGRAMVTLLLAGLVAGLGAGLKLTNAVYALALCAALLAVPLSWPSRLRLGFVFGIGALLGLSITGGFWFLEMWHNYGNPLYPQFSAVFPSTLTRHIDVGDVRYLPKSLLQMLLWPFLFTLDSRYVGELRVLQVIWALLYVLFLIWGVQALLRRLRRQDVSRLDPRRLCLLIYIAVGFLLWMQLFSVYRYLVAIELVAPLAVFILLTHMLEYAKARRIAVWALTASACIVLVGSTRSWGHEPWTDPMLRADTPTLTVPASTTVLTVGEADGQPYAWLALFFQREVAFAGVHTSFPAAQGYVARVHAMSRGRGGPVYALIAGYARPTLDDAQRASLKEAVTRVNAWAGRLGFAESGSGCLLLHWLGEKLRLDAHVQQTPMAGGEAHCELLLPEDDATKIAALNRAFIKEYAGTLALYGFELEAGSCVVYAGHIGEGSYPYQWCKVIDTSMSKRTPPAV